jgi:hypothetical protein
MGRTLTPQQEISQLRDLIREAHEVLKDLRGALREARAAASDMVTRFDLIATREIQQLGNHLQQCNNQAAADLNAEVQAARVELTRQLAMSHLERDNSTDTWRVIFQAGRFDDQIPLPHPQLLPKEQPR